jgi:hypothetical protein
MSFLHPALAVAGAAAATIPIIIHLVLRWRMPHQPWGAMRFIEAAMEQRRRKLRIQTWMLLLMRCLLLLFIGVALAQPQMSSPGQAGGQRRLLTLVVDAGAMGRLEEANGLTIDRLARAVLQIIGALRPADRIMIVRADEPNRVIVEPTRGHSVASGAVQALDASARPVDLPAALQTAATMVNRVRESDEVSTIVVLTAGFEGSFVNLREVTAPGETALWALNRPREAPTNVQITDLTIDRGLVVRRSALPTTATATFRRTGDDAPPGDTEIHWYTIDRDGVLTAFETTMVQWTAGERREQSSVVIPTDLIDESTRGIAVRSGGDVQVVDNERYASLLARDSLDLAVLDNVRGAAEGEISAADWLEFALSPEPGGPMRVNRSEPTLFQAEKTQADVVLIPDAAAIDAKTWSEVLEYRAAKGDVVVFPPAEETAAPWPAPLGIEAAATTLPTPSAWSSDGRDYIWIGDRGTDVSRLAGDVSVERMWSLSGSATGDATVLIRLAGGEPILYRLDAGDSVGDLLISALPLDLDWSTLPARPIMPLLMHELVLALCEARLIRDVPELAALRDGPPQRRDPGWQTDNSSLLNPDAEACSTNPVDVHEQLKRTTLNQEWNVGTAEDIVSALESADAPGGLGRGVLIGVLMLSVLEMYCARRWSYAQTAGRAGVRA